MLVFVVSSTTWNTGLGSAKLIEPRAPCHHDANHSSLKDVVSTTCDFKTPAPLGVSKARLDFSPRRFPSDPFVPNYPLEHPQNLVFGTYVLPPADLIDWERIEAIHHSKPDSRVVRCKFLADRFGDCLSQLVELSFFVFQ